MALAAGGGAAAAQTITLRDDRGAAVTLAAPPQRIVSLLPSLTESVCALGACARLVGVDRHSNHPPEVRALPQVGGLDDSNIEAIVALKPDLVLAGTSARVLARLESLGLKVAALEPRDLAATQQVLARLDSLLGTRAAPALWQRIDAQVQAAANAIPAAARGARVYVEVASGPYAASEASFIGELLVRLGLVNIVPAALGPFPLLNPEHVVRADPDLIVIAARHAGELAARAGWSRLRALREDARVCALTPADGDLLARAGPRIGEAAALLARCAARAAPR
jgi:iron complex transport system substrate-binding protein